LKDKILAYWVTIRKVERLVNATSTLCATDNLYSVLERLDLQREVIRRFQPPVFARVGNWMFSNAWISKGR